VEGEALVGWSLQDFPVNKTEKLYFVRHIAGRGFETYQEWTFSLTFKRSGKTAWPRPIGGDDVVKVSIACLHTISTPIIREIESRLPPWATPIYFLSSFVEFFVAV